jgi:hypothetical protein
MLRLLRARAEFRLLSIIICIYLTKQKDVDRMQYRFGIVTLQSRMVFSGGYP